MKIYEFVLLIVMNGTDLTDPIEVMSFESEKSCRVMGEEILQGIKDDTNIQANAQVKPGYQCKKRKVLK